ncbi:MAG: DUF433 domain-containing protein [Thermomicrobiales bacterium]|nr:DUF433 domain-containing protein [Thermomicrobiales bacterium]
MEATSEFSQRITRNPEVLGGKPIIRGTRIAVDLVMDWIEAGVPREEILEDYPNLTAADLDAAVEFDRTTSKWATPI